MRKSSMSQRLAVLLAGAGLMSSCVFSPAEVPLMGSAKVTSDFDTYQVRRVGLVPFGAVDQEVLAAHEVGALETTFHAEFASGTDYDIVPLRGLDLMGVVAPDPFRAGWYSPEGVLTLRDRYRLDALLVGTITSRRIVPPQVLGVQLDLVSCETGATIWTCDLILDASRESTRDAIEIWARRELGDPDGAPLTLLSPKKFAHFAAFQMARLL